MEELTEQESSSRGILKAALGWSKYKHFTNDECIEDANMNPDDDLDLSLDKVSAHDTVRQQFVVAECHSSSDDDGDDEHAKCEVNRFCNFFDYQQLQDDFGSCPVPVTVNSKSGRCNVVPRDARLLPRGIISKCGDMARLMSGVDGTHTSDRDFDHECCEHPLLDDDELQVSYPCQTSAVKQAVTMLSAPAVSTSTAHNFLIDSGQFMREDDVFAAAPFRKPWKGWTPTVATVPSSASFCDTDLGHHTAETCSSDGVHCTLLKPALQAGVSSHCTLTPFLSLQLGDTVCDVFGNAPFGDKRAPGANCCAPASQVSSWFPQSMVACSDVGSLYDHSVNHCSVTEAHSSEGNSDIFNCACSGALTGTAAQLNSIVPKTPSSDTCANRTSCDPFWSVPFSANLEQFDRPAVGKSSSHDNQDFLASATAAAKLLSSDEKSNVLDSFACQPLMDFSIPFETNQSFAFRSEDHDLDDDSMIGGSVQRKFLMSGSSRRASRDVLVSRNVSDSAFSNLSFNDEDEGEISDVLSKRQVTAHSQPADSPQILRKLHSHHHISHVLASTASVPDSPINCDRKTWPCKQKQCTVTINAELFSVKK